MWQLLAEKERRLGREIVPSRCFNAQSVAGSRAGTLKRPPRAARAEVVRRPNRARMRRTEGMVFSSDRM